MKLMLVIFIYFTVVYVLTYFYKQTANYFWYDLHFKNEPYYLKNFLNDVPHHFRYFKIYKNLLFLAVKVIIYFLYPIIKFIQIFICIFFVLYYISLFLINLVYKKTFTMRFAEPYIDPRSRFLDFIFLILYFIPKAKAFNTTYDCLYKIIKRKKENIDFYRIVYNFIISKLLGISLWNIFMLDLVSIEVYNSFFSPEVKKKKKIKVWWQVLNESLLRLFLIKLNNTLQKASLRKIIKNEFITFNPMFKNIFKKFTTIEETSQAGSDKVHLVTSPNGKKHLGVESTKFKNTDGSTIISGSICTHKPLTDQKSIKIEPKIGSKDKRLQHITTNTIYEWGCISDAPVALTRKTGFTDRDLIEGVSNLREVCDVVDYHKTYDYQKVNSFETISVNKFKKEFTETPKLSPKSMRRNEQINDSFVNSRSHSNSKNEKLQTSLVNERTSFKDSWKAMAASDKKAIHRGLETIHTKILKESDIKQISDHTRVFEKIANSTPHSEGLSYNHTIPRSYTKSTNNINADDET